MNESIDDILGLKGREIQQAFDELHRNEIKSKVYELKLKMPHLGRCPICTLPVPCKHFSSKSKISKDHVEEPLLTHTIECFDFTDYLPKIIPEPNKRCFKVRYKGQNSIYNFDYNLRNTSLPNEKRLKRLENIESYREYKLKREKEKINFLKEEEECKKKHAEHADIARQKYLKKQKEKVQEYNECLVNRIEKIKAIVGKDEEKRKVAEERKVKYYEEQKMKLEEYYLKKEIMKKIAREKVLELQEEVVNFKPIKIKHVL
ncbi:hypothetical protein SteCoe_32990 [Stentor coeruleus]|uniref:Uncharacterized protein n=1 Tax=Stentor coeruleus TaxID=5963 RepID=A0A1R2AY71_9CILI|nr:hypothetical protein SteCoe_32990 [Stentor coeruleus]